MRSFLMACVVAVSLSAAASAQQGTYTERVEVARLLIDARVLDDQGRAVRELGVGDFVVKVGGKPARVESVQWVSGADPDAMPLEPAPLESAPLQSSRDAASGRLIVFVFQKSLERGRIVGFMRMLIEARGLLDTLQPEDRVAVLSFDSRLQIWLDFTNNFDRVRRVFEHGILFERSPPVQESRAPSLVRLLDPRQASRTYSIERALRRIAEAIHDLPGAKSVILVGHGFGRFGPMGVTMENEYDEMRDALQAARASVFCLDVTEADYHSLEAGLQLVAADTGGFFARTHIFPDRALDRLVGALAGHYVLFVERPALDRGTHGIEVRLLKRRGTVMARTSYVALASDRAGTNSTAATSDRAAASDRATTSDRPATRERQSSCRMTTPHDSPVVPGPPYPPTAPAGAFWHGTPALWTMVPIESVWRALPRGENGYRQKVFLWRPGYDGRSEQWPDVTMTGKRLDGAAGAIVTEPATNAYRRDFGGWAMLVAVELPTHGCWELTARHGQSTVTFIVNVLP